MEAIDMCAVHADAHSTGTCARCGNFVCPLCLDASSALSSYCAECRHRAGDERIAWDRDEGSWVSRWLTTVRDIAFRPGASFERAQPGSLGRALGFVVANAFVIGLVQSFVVALVVLARSDSPSQLSVMGLGAVAVVVWSNIQQLVGTAIFGAAFYAGARLAGGRGSFTTSLWAVSYVGSITLLLPLISIFQLVPIVTPFIALVTVTAITVWCSILLTRAARRFHELEGMRAVFAGWFPAFAFLALMTLFCCGTALVTLVTPPG